MKRPIVRVELYTDGGHVLNFKSAFNSGVTESERMVREYARTRGEMFTGGETSRVGDVYRRTWVGDDTGAVAHVVVELERTTS